MHLMRIARINDAFELRRGEEAVRDKGFRQEWAVGWHGRRNRGHGGGLHKCCRMLPRAVDPDRLQVIGLIDRVLQRAIGFAPGFRQAVKRGGFDIIKGMLASFLSEGAGFLAGGMAEGMQVGPSRAFRHRQSRTGRAGRRAAALRAVGQN